MFNLLRLRSSDSLIPQSRRPRLLYFLSAKDSLRRRLPTLVKAANVSVESYWPGLFAKLVEKRNIEDLIMNAGSGGGGAAVAVTAAPGGAAAAAPAAAAAVEEKKEEPKEESDDDMGFSLFD
ncbi:hypothetical protein F0562_026785 [Nyssa sinensis]|uniref:60S acidic ribosomal protein P1 n=1 Tax=Nyssa sinensis TaxID=561372 RepID=A0A5J5BAB8_9ASTE|nr:hypothetical protein F0562_026785 [Nyssa sinensis]